ncbi:zinc knuckle CX2CX4HX4C containing protein [Tanacetum coccineum]|uniref:Zinc knuckle CX2CX4HX4C containing protein n=1 Tax=Tanacetum coccineum TaxID=301880 RepID=A0ABQ4XEC9_9ASTR
MHAQVNTRVDNKTLFCSFIYADNYYMDRRALWSNLVGHAGLMRNKPWVLLGDFNAALNFEDHSAGGYELNVARHDFKECVQAMEEGFREIIESEWSINVEGFAMLRVVTRLKGLKSPFRKLLHNYGNLHEQVNKIHTELDEAQKAIDRDPSSSTLHEEHAHYLLAFKEAQLDKERFLKQKAKVPDVFDDEVKSAIFSMADDRAPGPDGFTVAFFKKAWDVVGGDITCAIRDFFL